MDLQDTRNPYLYIVPAHSDSHYPEQRHSGSKDTICEALNRCGRKVEDASRKLETYADNLWNHLRVSPSLTQAAMARVSQGTKLLTDGGLERAFHQTFGSITGEKLYKSFACYMSTSNWPMIGTLYVTNKRVAFCSDYPWSRGTYPNQPEAMFLKVVLTMEQVRGVNSSTNVVNRKERYIQIVSVDGYEFWFIGFMSYDKAFKVLSDVVGKSRGSNVSVTHG